MVTGVDLVRAQLRLAAGATLVELGLDRPALARPRGYAMQLRVNAERLQADGSVLPARARSARSSRRRVRGPRGFGGIPGAQISAAFDSLLAKLVVHAADPEFDVLLRRARRAAAEWRIEGVATNLPLLQALLARPELACGAVTTRFVDEHAAALVGAAQDFARLRQGAAQDAGRRT